MKGLSNQCVYENELIKFFQQFKNFKCLNLINGRNVWIMFRNKIFKWRIE